MSIRNIVNQLISQLEEEGLDTSLVLELSDKIDDIESENNNIKEAIDPFEHIECFSTLYDELEQPSTKIGDLVY